MNQKQIIAIRVIIRIINYLVGNEKIIDLNEVLHYHIHVATYSDQAKVGTNCKKVKSPI